MCQFCQAHWQALRAAVEATGAGHLISLPQDAPASAVKAALEGYGEQEHAKAYDPLLNSAWMILRRALTSFGFKRMQGRCPVCQAMIEAHRVRLSHKEIEHFWLQGPAGAAFREAQSRGLMVKQ